MRGRAWRVVRAAVRSGLARRVALLVAGVVGAVLLVGVGDELGVAAPVCAVAVLVAWWGAVRG